MKYSFSHKLRDKAGQYTVVFFITVSLLLIALPSCLALDLYHKQGTDLMFGVTSNNATECFLITINSPTESVFINQTGTRNSQIFNFTIDKGNYSEVGVYCHNIECSDGSEQTSGSECYTINYFGKELKSSQATLYLGLIAVLVFVLFATFFGMGFLPYSNTKNEEGKILSISYLKYLRLPLWMFAYFLFVGIIFLSSNIAYAFLSEQLFGKILFSVSAILMALAPVIVIVLFISFFVKFYHDKEFQRLINRGMFPQEL